MGKKFCAFFHREGAERLGTRLCSTVCAGMGTRLEEHGNEASHFLNYKVNDLTCKRCHCNIIFSLGSSSSEVGRLRLVDGDVVVPSGTVVPRAVRLEVFLEDEWGSICGPEFDRLAAHVACQQLNYSTAVDVQLGGYVNYHYESLGLCDLWIFSSTE